MSRRIRLIVAYDGTNYVGWQLQDNGVSVQQRLNEAALAITGEQIQLHGSGRTDSGVHALAQVAHFDTNARMPANKFAIALNMRLPRDIRVLYSEEAPEELHARFSAKNKTYRYTVQLGLHADVFARTTSLHVHTPSQSGTHAASRQRRTRRARFFRVHERWQQAHQHRPHHHAQ
ncbi:MAG: tRNA pseudouridine synthase A [Eubacteriales bacterium]